MSTLELFGYRISANGVENDAAEAFVGVGDGRCRYMACANPHSLVVASKDRQFRIALQQAYLLIPDGSGIVLAARVLRGMSLGKVAGYDFFSRVCELANGKGGRKFFFLGASDHVLGLIKSRLQRDYPNIEVFVYSPPFKKEFSDADNRAMVAAVNKAAPDVLWVGMTAPKQEKWLLAHRRELDVPFAAAIGAVFDFYAGTKKRSSDVWIRLGLEWLPRFFKEPRRLWERNLKSTPIFLWWVVREKCRLFITGTKNKA